MHNAASWGAHSNVNNVFEISTELLTGILLTFIISIVICMLQGPGCMTTEMKERFKVPSASDIDLYHKTVGDVENTGYTSNHNIEPLTFHPDYAYLNDAPVSQLWIVHLKVALHIHLNLPCQFVLTCASVWDRSKLCHPPWLTISSSVISSV